MTTATLQSVFVIEELNSTILNFNQVFNWIHRNKSLKFKGIDQFSWDLILNFYRITENMIVHCWHIDKILYIISGFFFTSLNVWFLLWQMLMRLPRKRSRTSWSSTTGPCWSPIHVAASPRSSVDLEPALATRSPTVNPPLHFDNKWRNTISVTCPLCVWSCRAFRVPEGEINWIFWYFQNENVQFEFLLLCTSSSVGLVLHRITWNWTFRTLDNIMESLREKKLILLKL